MKIKLTLPPEDQPQFARLWQVENRRPFYRTLYEQVLSYHFGVENALARRAAFFPHRPDEMDDMGDGVFGVAFQLSGISRGNRTAEAFREAYSCACALVIQLIKGNVARGTSVHVMVQFAIDAEVEARPGTYTTLMDSFETVVDGEFNVDAAA